jgi:soluble lytic murein transglycosylase-like protein
MQLMLATAANGRAPRFGLRRRRSADDPRANIEMGTAFLGGLMKEFSIHGWRWPPNAGPRVRWWQSKTGDVEVVEQIPSMRPASIKRDALWEEYRRIYGGSEPLDASPTPTQSGASGKSREPG